MATLRAQMAATMLLAALAVATPASAARIVLNNLGGFEQGSAAAVAMNQAANFWASRITNDITINLDVGFLDTGPTTLAYAVSSRRAVNVQSVYAALASTGQSALDAQAVANLSPLVSGEYSGFGVDSIEMYTPGYTGVDGDGFAYGIDNANPMLDANGTYNNTVIAANTANLKALGILTDPSIKDGQIIFNTLAAYDFNPANGVDPDGADFIGVAIHEIGHALGFSSGVDTYDYYGAPGGPGAFSDQGDMVDCSFYAATSNCSDYYADYDVFGELADLFRWGDLGDGPRLNWVPGTESYFSLDGGVTNLGNFDVGAFSGGFQASHWKFSETYEGVLGIMDPASFNGEMRRISGLDFAFFDAIGYNFNFDFSPDDGDLFTSAAAVPEPGAWLVLISGFALAGAALRRRRAVVA